MERVRLRALKEKDVGGMLEWMHDPDIQQNFRNDMGRITKEMAIDFIREARKDWKKNLNLHLAITDAEDEYMGTISLKNIDLQSKRAEYAISLRKKAQGKGIGYAASKKILEYAFIQMQLERIYLNVLKENKRAIALYERVGFIYEGEFRKHLYLRGVYRDLQWYGMLKEDYMCIMHQI